MPEALLPVGRPSNIPTLIQQFDAIEVQHQGIGHQESPLSLSSGLEFLTKTNVCVNALILSNNDTFKIKSHERKLLIEQIHFGQTLDANSVRGLCVHTHNYLCVLL